MHTRGLEAFHEKASPRPWKKLRKPALFDYDFLTTYAQTIFKSDKTRLEKHNLKNTETRPHTQ
jgi:hypothetical protein